LHLGTGVLLNCAERPRAVFGEFVELISTTAHDVLPRVKALPSAPYVRYIIAGNDRLIPEDEQRAGIQDVRFDEVIIYDAGHIAPARKDGRLARAIFALDDGLAPPPSYSEDPRLVA
jgi:hypothetical protein